MQKSDQGSILSFRKIREELSVNDEGKPHVFLGNGFNMAIGVNTSYFKLKDRLLNDYAVGKILMDNKEARKLRGQIAEKPGRMEIYINASKIRDTDKVVIKGALYNEILSACKVKYKYKETIAFLKLFDKFFTTNYDPLLYLFLLSGKAEEAALRDRAYYEAVEQINAGFVEIPGIGSVNLDDMTKKHVCETAMKLLKEKFEKKTMKQCYAVLKVIREENIIPLRDGFGGKPARRNKVSYLRWMKDKEKIDAEGDDVGEINLFYLHGALHLFRYQDKEGEYERTGKISSRGGKKFVDCLLRMGENAICVFNHTSKQKEKSINSSDYLSDCRDRLAELKGRLCIVGWSCAKNDEHLIKIINKNSDITKLFISFYKGDKQATIKRCKKVFSGKEMAFFDIDEVFNEEAVLPLFAGLEDKE